MIHVKDDLRRRKKNLGPHTSFRIHADIDARVRAYCRASDQTFKGILEEALTEYLDARGVAAAPAPAPMGGKAS